MDLCLHDHLSTKLADDWLVQDEWAVPLLLILGQATLFNKQEKNLKLASPKTRTVTQASLEVLPLHLRVFTLLVNSLHLGNMGKMLGKVSNFALNIHIHDKWA